MMRQSRKTAWWLMVAAGLAAGASWGTLGEPKRAGACSMAAMTADFDGTIVAIDGGRVAYRVDRVRQDDAVGQGRLPEPGGTVVVHYDGAPRQLALDPRYRVRGWSFRSAGVSSQIAHDFHGDCGTGAGTTALDGSYLAMSSNGLRRMWLSAVAGLVVVGGVVLAVHALVAHRQDRTRR